jgi:protein TonB
MSWALGLSLALHAALLFIQLGGPASVDRLVRDKGLEVILVNTQSDEKKPSKARALAQTHLAGGGEAAARRATSPLVNAPQTQSGQADDQRQSKLTQREIEQNELLALAKRNLATLTAKQAQQPDPAFERQRQEMLNMLAQIEKRIQEENARPRKRYISPSTQEINYALYYDQLRRKIEARGTLFFPESQGQKLYGSLIMVITIGLSGQLVSAEVSQSSGNAILDMQAKNIVKGAAPFGRFTDQMRQDMDQLALVTRFSFDRSNNLQTSLEER